MFGVMELPSLHWLRGSQNIVIPSNADYHNQTDILLLMWRWFLERFFYVLIKYWVFDEHDSWNYDFEKWFCHSFSVSAFSFNVSAFTLPKVFPMSFLEISSFVTLFPFSQAGETADKSCFHCLGAVFSPGEQHFAIDNALELFHRGAHPSVHSEWWKDFSGALIMRTWLSLQK